MIIISFLRKIIPCFLLDFYHLAFAFLGAVFYRRPSRKIKVIGITGTNGKTTVIDLINRILEEAGFKVAFLSSIKFKIGEEEKINALKMTMPGRFKIQKFLKKAADSGCQYAVLEVTSEGILQHRHRFIDFEAAVLTNLSPEHIERHGGFENYKKAKGELFKAAKKNHIINIDDKSAGYFLKFPSKQKFYYSSNESLDIKLPKIVRDSFFCGKAEENWKLIKAVGVRTSNKGTEFTVNNIKFDLELLGGFNAGNALAAICLAVSQGIDLETCQKALVKIKGIPGRMEEVIKEPFKVFVDYAFTPSAFQKVYETFKSEKSKLICVFGAAGGGRDKWKRPVLGEIAAKYCHKIIITDEDPYDENPEDILSMIESGVFKSKFPISDFYKILDRRKAIKKALELAEPNDRVIITGKGCEPWLCLGRGKKIPWDDRQVVREEFNKQLHER
jgi:UDP-N-acetylmuramoyl-L-alanyl-D-glutamate--2,6-diaminopimelate ligase